MINILYFRKMCFKASNRFFNYRLNSNWYIVGSQTLSKNKTAGPSKSFIDSRLYTYKKFESASHLQQFIKFERF